MQAMSIGLPTNVTHQGHATSIEDAQSLIEKLMVGRGTSLPPPLLPESGETTVYTSIFSLLFLPIMFENEKDYMYLKRSYMYISKIDPKNHKLFACWLHANIQFLLHDLNAHK